MDVIKLTRDRILSEYDSAFDNHNKKLNIKRKIAKYKINEGYDKIIENALQTINITRGKQ